MYPRATHRDEIGALPRVLGRRGVGSSEACGHVGRSDGLVREKPQRPELRGAEIPGALGHHRLGVPLEEVGGAPQEVVAVEALMKLAVGSHRFSLERSRRCRRSDWALQR